MEMGGRGVEILRATEPKVESPWSLIIKYWLQIYI